MKKCFLLSMIACIFTNLITLASSEKPNMVIKSITNNTPYRLKFIDRFDNDSRIIEAGSTIPINYSIENSKNIVIQGYFKEILSKEAQFLILKLTENNSTESNKESYVNMTITPGGIDDGSGITIGTLGTNIFKFFMANAEGGCIMASETIKETPCDTVGIDLDLNISETNIAHNIFRLAGTCTYDINNPNVVFTKKSFFNSNHILNNSLPYALIATGVIAAGLYVYNRYYADNRRANT
ncbi:MAG: hypothetical protein Q8Q60_03190 [Candidatus Chromulinivorax sp.]|nr:hypothetical protein [Candidatus Chromulinivorax sp.]